jgi:hypothetical protein
MLEAYGVWGKKSMYGRTFLGITRTTFLIGGDGRIARIWPKVKVDGHAADVLAAAKLLPRWAQACFHAERTWRFDRRAADAGPGSACGICGTLTTSGAS